MSYYLKALELLKILHDNNHEAYIVGGFVRDFLLGENSSEIDITTSATHEELSMIFDAKCQYKNQFSCCDIYLDDYKYEITTFRKDTYDLNSRLPQVENTKDILVDLKRRDFTCNALLINYEGKVIDYLNYKDDVLNKKLRLIGDKELRYQEDPLRVLRGIYLIARFGFSYEEETLNKTLKYSSLVSTLSGAKIKEALIKILSQKRQQKALEALVSTNVISYLPKLEKAIKMYLNQNKRIPDFDTLVCLGFYLEGYSEIYCTKKYDKKLYSLVNDLLLLGKDNNYNNLLLYSYGDTACVISSRINSILYNIESLEEDIIRRYKNLAIKKVCDLSFKGQDIIKITNDFDNLSFISEIVDDIKYEVVMGNLENDYHIIKEYVLSKYILK